MKRRTVVFLSGIFIFLLLITFAFAENMIITTKDGKQQVIPTSNIQKIEFTGGVTQPAGFTEHQYFRIIAKHSGKCTDVEGVRTDNGANVYQWDCHGGDNQAWKFVQKGQDYYMIVAKHSGKCLDVAGWGTQNGTNVIQWDCHGGNNQIWKVVPKGYGYYMIISKHSNKCLDVAGVSNQTGANIYQWDCHGGNNQLWKIE